MSPLHSRSAYVPRGIMPHLRLLGPTELETDAGRSIDRLLAQPKSVALLAFLAAAGNGFHRRDRLVGLFWPETDDRSARRNLRGRIHLLRKHLGEGVVVSRGDDEVGLDPDRVRCDVWEFEDAVAGEAWERALELYRGDLLEGFHLNGDGVFLHWLDGRRAELRAMAAEAARSRSRQAERAGDLRTAVDTARRLVGLAPTDEVAVRRLLILLDAAGDRAGVAAAYEAFERRLEEEYELEPAPETGRLVEELLNRSELNGPVPNGAETRAAIPIAVPGDPDRTGPPGGSGGSGGSGPPPPRNRAGDGRRRPGWGGRLFLAASGIAAMGAALWLTGVWPGEPEIEPRRVLIAVAPEEGSPDLSTLADQGAHRLRDDLLASGLPATPYLDGDLLDGKPPQGLHQRRQILDVAKDWKIGTVVLATARTGPDGPRVDADIMAAPSGKVLYSLTTDGAGVPADTLLHRLSQRVLGGLAIRLGDTPVDLAPIVRHPPTYRAYQHFVRGMELYSEGMTNMAAQHYRRAYEVDPGFSLAYLELKTVVAMGDAGSYEHELVEFLSSASLDSTRLSEAEKHHLEWIPNLDMATTSRGRLWVVGRENLRRAMELAPERYASLLAYAEHKAGNPEEAAALLETLDPERNLVPNFPVIYGSTLHALGRDREWVEFVNRHEDMRGSVNMIFAALGALGDTARIFDLLEERVRARGPWGAVIARLAARELRCHGHPEEAEAVLRWTAEQVEPLLPQEGHDGGGFAAPLADIFYQLGDLDRVELLYDRWVEGGFPEDHFLVIEGRARLAAHRGRGDEVRQWLGRLDQVDPKPSAAMLRQHLTRIEGILEWTEGERPEAPVDPPLVRPPAEAAHCVPRGTLASRG